ncbi:unnamed protein product [Closterium sp. Naga37s-1]|nr:unnamed protein product [Closterium sp. Naga37s-1]
MSTAAGTNGVEAAETSGAEAAVMAGPEAVAVAAPEAAADGEAPEDAAAAGTTAGCGADLGRAGETAAAVGDGSFSPSATPQGASRLAEERGPVAEQGQLVEERLAASPAPVAAVEIAAVVTAAAADGRQGPGKSVAAPAAREKKGKRPRAQPAARRPGAGLGPGPPGPLLGWLLQGQSPQEPTRPSSSRGGPSRQVDADEEIAADEESAQEPEMPPPTEPGNGNRATPAATEAAAATDKIAPPQTGTRRSARLGAITWGPPRGGRTPWMPAGRGGLNGAAGTAGGARRGAHEGLRGGLRGGRGGRNRAPRSDIPVRIGPWRERHDRPVRQEAEAGANEEHEASDNSGNDPEFMGGEEVESEEISLDEEQEPGRRATQHQEGAAGESIRQNPTGGGEPATEDTDVPSPADLAGDDAIWQAAGAWDAEILQKGDQPFLVRRLPPQILDIYSLCMLAALHRLDKNPSCPGGWFVLQFLPRLTLRPAPEPASGSRWAHIEARLHKFQRGEWADLFEAAGVIPDTGGPIRHQGDDEGSIGYSAASKLKTCVIYSFPAD